MRPDPARVLTGVMSNLMTLVLPETRTAFGQTTTGMCASLVYCVAQEFDRIVDRLLVETRVVAQILTDAAPLLQDEALRNLALDAATRTTPENYRVSTVQSLNDDIRRVLIEVHAAIEQTPGDAAAEMNERIWRELQESTQRRRLELGR